MNAEKEIADVLEINIGDWMFYRNASWKLKFVWFPKRCDKSKKLLWLSREYRGERRNVLKHDLGMTKILTTEVRWLSKREFIFGKLKGTI